MKIVSWNLKNIGQSKLSNKFQPQFAGYGLGNDVLDYITNFVTYQYDNKKGLWDNVPGLNPGFADIFVIIELKTGGNQKDKPISGTCIPTLNDVTGRLNLLVNNAYPVNPPIVYKYAIPRIVGYHETVGVIYNSKLLQHTADEVFRNTANGNWINPRSPFGVEFKTLTGQTLSVVGIHAPPPKGSGDVKYKPPIQWCVQLPNTKFAKAANVLVMGDFNCNPTSYYKNGVNKIYPFTNMAGFKTYLPNGTLSSVRTKVAKGKTPPDNYLSDAYDNIILNAAVKNVSEIVPDTLKYARNIKKMGWPDLLPKNLVAVLNAYNKVSDHLPVVIEFS